MGDTGRTEGSDADRIEASLVDPEAFTVLFERHAGSVHRYLVTRVGRRDAEDLVGETFATAFRSRTSYALDRPDARPWLFGIATNLARHHWRSEGRRLKRDALPGRSSDGADHSEEVASRAFFQGQSELIAQALGQLDEAYLDVLLLVAGPGLSYAEISEALGIPEGTVRSRLSRARGRLRELLGDPGQYLEEASPGEQPSIATEGWS
jgi:RNA polymerase sigma factor (sigma-70 family)